MIIRPVVRRINLASPEFKSDDVMTTRASAVTVLARSASARCSPAPMPANPAIARRGTESTSISFVRTLKFRNMVMVLRKELIETSTQMG